MAIREGQRGYMGRDSFIAFICAWALLSSPTPGQPDSSLVDLADYDQNGSVELTDFIALGSGYNGVVAGNPHWAVLDHDRSGIVDFPDFLFFAFFFGMTSRYGMVPHSV